MSEEEDLELLALQRQLDDAFQTTRPRPAFEDELWLRMQSRRPIFQRLREGVAGLIQGLREGPAVPSAAVALVLIVLVGAGILTLSKMGPAGSATSSLSSPTKQANAGTQLPQAADLAFGRLPAPALVAGVTAVPSASPGAGLVYAAPVTLTWAGTLEVTTTALPVFRYQEPARATADKFAASIGARPAADVAQDALGVYSGKNFTVVVIGTVPKLAREPSFQLSDRKSVPSAPGADPVAVATAYLASHGLVPSWPYQTDVQTDAGTVRVRFLRTFDLQAQGQAILINRFGDRYGTEVDTAANAAGAFETGPLPLVLDSANYPIINADQAVRSALASSAPSAGGNSYPVVQLTQAELVYQLVVAGDHSFYEPAFLFTGTFTDHGITYVERVLVPAVAPSLLSH